MTTTATREPAPPIDPRIRARRIEVARDSGRRRLRRLAIVSSVVAVALAAWGVATSPLLDVDAVDVLGAQRSGADAVRRAAGLAHGSPMVTLDLATATARVEALPWVADATLVRRWPGAVEVAVDEWEPAGAIPLPGGRGPARSWMLVSRFGDQLEQVADRPEGLVEVRGVAGAGEPAVRLSDAAAPLSLVGQAPASLRSRLREVRLTGRGELEATVSVGDEQHARARLGAPVDLPAKLLSLSTVVDHADLAGTPLIDVRVPASPVLTHD